MSNIKRYVLLVLGLSLLFPGASFALEPLLVKGKIFQEKTVQKKKQWVPLVKVELNPGELYKVGEAPDAKALKENPKAKLEQSIAIKGAKEELITMLAGSTFRYQRAKGGSIQLEIQGEGHLFHGDKTKETSFDVNGITFHLKGAHLAILGDQILLAEGEATANLNPPAKDKEVKPDPLKVGDQLSLNDKGQVQLKENLKFLDQNYKNTLLPGFAKLSTYNKAGKVEFKGESLELTRMGDKITLVSSPGILLEGDQIHTATKQAARLILASEDQIDLGPKTNFTIDQFKPKAEVESLSFSFLGRVRAKIRKRQKMGMIRLRTVTTTIGVKGTEFDVVATQEMSQVATLEGLVSVADPSGLGEQLLKPGMMSQIPAGGMPSLPTEIPAEMMKALMEGVFDAALDALVPDVGAMFGLAAAAFALLPDGGDDEEKPEVLPPKLSPETLLDNLTLKESGALSLSWDKPMATIVLSVNGTEVPVEIGENKTIGSVNMAQLFLAAKAQPQVTLQIKATSEEGGETELEKSIQLLFKPTSIPALVDLKADGPIPLIQGQPLKLTADRPVSWSLTLDGQFEIKSPAPKAAVEGAQADHDAAQFTAERNLDSTVLDKLTEGEHSLTVVMTDEFEQKGQVKLTLLVDRKPPELIDFQRVGASAPTASPEGEKPDFAKILADLNLLEGESLQMSFNEPLASLKFVFADQPITLTEDPQTKAWTLSAEEVGKHFGAANGLDVRLIAVDANGNQAVLNAKVSFSKKPAGAFTLKEVQGKTKLSLGGKLRVQIMASRQAQFFRAELFQGEERIKELEMPFKQPKANLELASGFFSGLQDGDYRLEVLAKDSFNDEARLTLALKLDQSPPGLDAESAGINFSVIKLSKGEDLKIGFVEPIDAFKATLEGKAWRIPLAGDRKSITLSGDDNLLGFAPKAYEFNFMDAEGNRIDFKGLIQLKTPRDKALRENYENSVLFDTPGTASMGILSKRPNFGLNNSEPLKGVKPDEMLKSPGTAKKPLGFVEEQWGGFMDRLKY